VAPPDPQSIHLLRQTVGLEAHETMAKLSETLRRKRRLRKKIRAVELGVDLAKNDVSRLDGLPQKMDPKIEVLGALTAADGALRPCNACLVVGKNDRGASRLV